MMIRMLIKGAQNIDKLEDQRRTLRLLVTAVTKKVSHLPRRTKQHSCTEGRNVPQLEVLAALDC